MRKMPLSMVSDLVLALQIIMGAATLVGVIRFIRRVGNMHMRAISSPVSTGCFQEMGTKLWAARL